MDKAARPGFVVEAIRRAGLKMPPRRRKPTRRGSVGSVSHGALRHRIRTPI